MSPDRHAQRIVIAGASSLLGSEVKAVLEESRFAAWNLRLVDEEIAVGTLTEAGGEATLIQRVEEDTFHGARYVFLTGSAEFAKECLAPAREAGATILDFSRVTLSDPDATPWFPKIEHLSGRSVAKNSKTFCVFSAAGTAVSSLALVLRRAGLQRLSAVVFQPVSEAGREGIEELETQTSQLLSFQSVGHAVFGAQAAFNLLPKFGEESRQDLQGSLLRLRSEISAAVCEPDQDARITLNLLHAPVFYGMTCSACADLESKTQLSALKESCKDAGFSLVADEEAGPSNVSVAGESSVFFRTPAPDASRVGTWWFWAAADNLRLPAVSGCKLAEWLES
jgi:aspartate-semialdehyde dehydrogenase